MEKGEAGVLTLLPMGLLLAAMLVMGIHAPAGLSRLLDKAAGQVLAGGAPTESVPPAQFASSAKEPVVPAAAN